MKRTSDSEVIHGAVIRRDVEAIDNMLLAGHELDARDKEGRTPLFYAARDGDVLIAAKLLDNGSTVNARDKNGETPLHFAARGYQPEVAEFLIQRGADIEAEDLHGNTPLWRAVFESKGKGGVIEVLVSSGADNNHKNSHGISPMDLAKSIANYDLVKFLDIE